MLHNLMQKKQDLNKQILNCLNNEVMDVKMAAENMAECATNMSGQGLTTFINAREDFLKKIEDLCKQIEATSDAINTHTYK